MPLLPLLQVQVLLQVLVQVLLLLSSQAQVLESL